MENLSRITKHIMIISRVIVDHLTAEIRALTGVDLNGFCKRALRAFTCVKKAKMNEWIALWTENVERSFRCKQLYMNARKNSA